MNTPRKFSMQQPYELLLRKPSTKEILAYLDDLKTSGLENTVEMTYPMGGRGNSYIGGGFSHSKRATLNVTMATWNTEVMAVQNGTEIATNDIEVVEYEVIEAPTENTVKTKYTAKGAAGSEIGFIYEVNADGTYGKKYTQSTTTTTSGSFSYATSGNTITFASDYKTGTDIAFAYVRDAGEGAQKLTVDTEAIPDTVLVTAFGFAKDICSGELFPCQTNGMAQVDGNYTFDLAADGDPSVHNLNLEFVKGCRSKKLYDFIVYTDEDAPAAAAMAQKGGKA